jgi:predicted HicB family RNase H-like nuclease
VNDQKKSRKVGRPKVSKKEAHSRMLLVRVTTDDYSAFVEVAKKNKLTLSKWIRQTLRNAI